MQAFGVWNFQQNNLCNTFTIVTLQPCYMHLYVVAIKCVFNICTVLHQWSFMNQWSFMKWNFNEHISWDIQQYNVHIHIHLLCRLTLHHAACSIAWWFSYFWCTTSKHYKRVSRLLARHPPCNHTRKIQNVTVNLTLDLKQNLLVNETIHCTKPPLSTGNHHVIHL